MPGNTEQRKQYMIVSELDENTQKMECLSAIKEVKKNMMDLAAWPFGG